MHFKCILQHLEASFMAPNFYTLYIIFLNLSLKLGCTFSWYFCSYVGGKINREAEIYFSFRFVNKFFDFWHIHLEKVLLSVCPLLICEGKILSMSEGCSNVQYLNGALETSEIKELKGREAMRSCSLTWSYSVTFNISSRINGISVSWSLTPSPQLKHYLHLMKVFLEKRQPSVLMGALWETGKTTHHPPQ